MKSRPLLAIALLATSAISGLAETPFEERQRSRLQALRTEEIKNGNRTPLERAYLDTYRMLSSDGQCSQFFGGRGVRLVLDELVIRLRDQVIPDPRIGVRMSGVFTTLVEPQEGIAYRLFERADLNILGPFYKAKSFPSQPFVPNMGSFRPNTREARALILLHELAHTIKGQNGKWLIPDDGNKAEASRLNTFTIESKCGSEIRNL